MRWYDLDRVIDNHGYLGDFPWIGYICSALGGSSVKFAGFSIGFIQLCSFLMSLNESRSGEMRMDFITFFFLGFNSNVNFDDYFYENWRLCWHVHSQVRVSVLSPLKVVLLQVVRVRAPLHQRLSIKSFFFLFAFFNYGGVGAGRCLSCRRVNPVWVPGSLLTWPSRYKRVLSFVDNSLKWDSRCCNVIEVDVMSQNSRRISRLL